MWERIRQALKGEEPAIIQLARRPDLDQETAFTICRLIDIVGYEATSDWDWDWLDGEKPDFRALIEIPVLRKAWSLLTQKVWLSLQTTNDEDKRISTIAPIAELKGLKTLILQNNLIEDLSPVAGMTGLVDLSYYRNRIKDLSPLRNLPLIEKLSLDHNPVDSLGVLAELPKLRELSLSIDQLPRFAECGTLRKLASLYISFNEDEAFEDFSKWPDMPSLKVLTAWHAKSLEGVGRFGTLECLTLVGGSISDLGPLSNLKALNHLSISTSAPLDATALAQLHALRNLSLTCPRLRGIAALKGLPALHQIQMDDESSCDVGELQALRAGLTSWDLEFRNEAKGLTPSLDLQVVDQETFDYYDSKADYGVQPDDCSDGMLDSERAWLLEKFREALSGSFEEDMDFHLPRSGGRRRTERVILYSAKAHESFREIALAVQRVLCETKNDWIIWTQTCLGEGPNEEEIPDEMENFKVWIFPDKITATEENATIVKKLIEWKG